MRYLRGARIGVTASVLGTAFLTVFTLGGTAYVRGRAMDPTERFFQEAGRPPTAGEGSVAASAHYALFSDEPNDVIFVGDSSCWNGIDPIRLRQMTGLQSYNLGVPGYLGARWCPMTVRAYLSRHPKPKAVVLCVSPLGLEVDSGPWEESLRRIVTFYGLEMDGVVPTSETVPYLVRSGVRALVGYPDYRALPLIDFNNNDTYLTEQVGIFAARGFYGLPPRAHLVIPPAEQGELIREDWDRGVHETADLCAAAGVKMLILFAPIEASYKDSRDFDGLDRWGRELEKTHPGLAVERPIILAYEARLMQDALHLNLAGVEKFMPVVAKDVQAALGTPSQHERAPTEPAGAEAQRLPKSISR